MMRCTPELCSGSAIAVARNSVPGNLMKKNDFFEPHYTPGTEFRATFAPAILKNKTFILNS